ncbi:hypothetical protein COT97_05645 [Candidatus Falkowbacteria bacterium CG10_big_fil_rev_8_21_14_0_10_39_11]|uniref:Uncharacterized protein n=1 Tax=Candidatus Falkowbacteria bacterium CG10_big_fil_rev_8_21_14_0_10_39_11 TaxID=1974565 RepID=A0A2H0V5J8_9BACT|nr:MAG: hypothetical protein COT97_05645 [Candidatus Falkowbacteria bacterium CG10_big_fil_rev_8_21_14_0_10_39_11]
MSETPSQEKKETFKPVKLSIKKPGPGTGISIAFETQNEDYTFYYNQACLQILKAANLEPFHQLGSGNEPGEHNWEPLTLEVTPKILEDLFPQIQKKAEELFNLYL